MQHKGYHGFQLVLLDISVKTTAALRTAGSVHPLPPLPNIVSIL